MEQEFDSSQYELASDYAWHLERTTGCTENESIVLAAKEYGLSTEELQDYCNSQG